MPSESTEELSQVESEAPFREHVAYLLKHRQRLPTSALLRTPPSQHSKPSHEPIRAALPTPNTSYDSVPSVLYQSLTHSTNISECRTKCLALCASLFMESPL